MNASFALIFLFTYLTGRLFFYDINNLSQATQKGFIKRMIYGLVVLFLCESLFAATLLFLLHISVVLADTFIKSKTSSSIAYIIHVGLAFIISQLAAGLIHFESLYLYNPFYAVTSWVIAASSVLGSLTHKSRANYPEIITGFIFTIKEGTIITRLVLSRMSAVPKKREEPENDDTKEYDRGKLIGILERSLIYFMIIFNQVTAVAIIIALKSLARFKELDDKNFAEYFLIGSLLSICVAVVPAVLIKLF